MRSTRRLQNLTGTLPKWWTIQNRAGEPTFVSIYDEIGMMGVSAGDFLAELAGVDGDLDVHISSPGGDVFDAIAIHNMLKQRKGKVAVTVDSLAASAASFIAQAASPGMLEMAPHSTMMIHDGFAMGIGNSADMRELADQLDKASDNIASIYAARSGKPADYWRAKMQATTWYSDEEAVADGLADRVSGQQNVKDTWDLTVFNAAPVEGEPTEEAEPVETPIVAGAVITTALVQQIVDDEDGTESDLPNLTNGVDPDYDPEDLDTSTLSALLLGALKGVST